MHAYRLLINGELITTSDELNVVNPATGEVFASCQAAVWTTQWSAQASPTTKNAVW